MAYIRTAGLQYDFEGTIRLYNRLNADHKRNYAKFEELRDRLDFEGAMRFYDIAMNIQNTMARLRANLDEMCTPSKSRRRK